MKISLPPDFHKSDFSSLVSSEKYKLQGIRMKKSNPNQNVQGSVLVVGSGIAGMQAALDMANSGFYVHIVERSPAIGGVMAQLDKTFPTNDCSM